MISKKAFSRAASVSINSWALGFGSLKFDSEWFQRGNFHDKHLVLNKLVMAIKPKNSFQQIIIYQQEGKESSTEKVKKTPNCTQWTPTCRKNCDLSMGLHHLYSSYFCALCILARTFTKDALLPYASFNQKKENKNLFFGANKVIIWRHNF